tara:strand:+ start:1887 stop:2531 length:645 start_codon:yes stop_codon:yes gene_type:complete
MLILKILFKIFLYDKFLCLIFGKLARWYQLHALINLIITVRIFPLFLKLITEPMNGYYNIVDNNQINLGYYVISLHLYHILVFKNLTKYDWLHHIVFVVLGVIPSMLYIKSNQTILHKISCSGVPGIIEYGSLSLYKNNYISRRKQKLINSILYTYLRLPLCIFGITMNYFAYINGLINDSLWITLYVNILLYLNGTVFTQLTNNSYYKVNNSI